MKMTKKNYNHLVKLKALLHEKNLHLKQIIYDRDHCRSESIRKFANNQIFMVELSIKNIKTSIEIINS